MSWAEEYQKLIAAPPDTGAVLTTIDGVAARLDLELVQGQAPFVYGRAFVPEIVGSRLDWFLQSVESKNTYGWKCILLPKARQECIRRLGITKSILPVKSLRVIRRSESGKSLLCEIAEYL